MAKKAPKAEATEVPSEELLRKLLAVNLYMAGANYTSIARTIGKGKTWVVATLRGLPTRQRQ
jgi:hypothetical protein